MNHLDPLSPLVEALAERIATKLRDDYRLPGNVLMYTFTALGKACGRSYETVRNWVECHDLPAVEINHVRYVTRADFEAWVATHRVDARADWEAAS